MRGRHLALAVALAGCGRLGFDEAATEAPDAGLGAQGTTDDGTERVSPCATSSVAATVWITGMSVEVPAFGGEVPAANVAIEVVTMAGSPWARTSSGGDGEYSLGVPTDGRGVDAYLALRKPGLLPTILVPDGPIDTDIVDLYTPVTSDYAISTLYLLSGVARNATAGTLGVMVVDCDGTPVTDATVTINPPPAAMVYTDAAGSPSTSVTSTRAKGLVYGLNVPAGTVSITASKTGETFLTHYVNVLDNSHVMGTRIRPVRARPLD
jgi:hypothetical protein